MNYSSLLDEMKGDPNLFEGIESNEFSKSIEAKFSLDKKGRFISRGIPSSRGVAVFLSDKYEKDSSKRNELVDKLTEWKNRSSQNYHKLLKIDANHAKNEINMILNSYKSLDEYFKDLVKENDIKNYSLEDFKSNLAKFSHRDPEAVKEFKTLLYLHPDTAFLMANDRVQERGNIARKKSRELLNIIDQTFIDKEKNPLISIKDVIKSRYDLKIQNDCQEIQESMDLICRMVTKDPVELINMTRDVDYRNFVSILNFSKLENGMPLGDYFDWSKDLIQCFGESDNKDVDSAQIDSLAGLFDEDEVYWKYDFGPQGLVLDSLVALSEEEEKIDNIAMQVSLERFGSGGKRTESTARIEKAAKEVFGDEFDIFESDISTFANIAKTKSETKFIKSVAADFNNLVDERSKLQEQLSKVKSPVDRKRIQNDIKDIDKILESIRARGFDFKIEDFDKKEVTKKSSPQNFIQNFIGGANALPQNKTKKRLTPYSASSIANYSILPSEDGSYKLGPKTQEVYNNEESSNTPNNQVANKSAAGSSSSKGTSGGRGPASVGKSTSGGSSSKGGSSSSAGGAFFKIVGTPNNKNLVTLTNEPGIAIDKFNELKGKKKLYIYPGKDGKLDIVVRTTDEKKELSTESYDRDYVLENPTIFDRDAILAIATHENVDPRELLAPYQGRALKGVLERAAQSNLSKK